MDLHDFGGCVTLIATAALYFGFWVTLFVNGQGAIKQFHPTV